MCPYLVTQDSRGHSKKLKLCLTDGDTSFMMKNRGPLQIRVRSGDYVHNVWGELGGGSFSSGKARHVFYIWTWDFVFEYLRDAS
jgi:hypothetical protein